MDHGGTYIIIEKCLECPVNGPIVTVLAGLFITAAGLAVILAGFYLWFLVLMKCRWLFDFLSDPEDKSIQAKE